MPQVPYVPYPTEKASDAGTPRVSISTPSAAFGENIGRALEGLGKTVEGAGGEIFNRAIALQQLQNETEAKEADAQYMIKAGELHANYSALQGKDRVDAYPKYVQDLQETRQKLRGSMSNDMARKMYDGSSLSTMGRSIFNGAGAAASANKEWAIGTSKAQIDLDVKTVTDNPNDPVLYEDKRRRIVEGAKNLSALQGLGDGSPQEQLLVKNATSHLRSQQIIGLSRTAPFEAAKLLDDKKTELTPEDYLKVDNSVRGASRAVGSVNIANGVFEAGRGGVDKPQRPLAEMGQEVRDKAKAQSPDDPLLEQHAISALRGRYNQDNYAKKQEDNDNLEIVRQGVLNGVKNEQELRADPKTAAAIDALHTAGKKLDIPGQINRYNSARDKQTNQEADEKLTGLRLNSREEFLNIDVTKLPLSHKDMTKWMNVQAKDKENTSADPRVFHALQTMRGSMGSQLQALGVYKRTDDNKDDFDHFTGTLSTAIDLWTAEHGGKPPSQRDVIEKIGPEVVQQRTIPGTFWNSKKPLFQQDVPADWSEKIKADVISKGGVEPTEEQLYRAYVRQQLIDLHEKKPNG